MGHKALGQLALLSLAIAAPLVAQGGGMGGMRMGGNPTKKVEGTGDLPAGWMVRFDPVRGNQPAPTGKDIKFVAMGSGFHFTSGPAAIYYNPKDMATGEFGVSATFTNAASLVHEAYGIFVGGHNLQDSTQNYLYLVVKPAEGTFQIKHRTSNARPNPGEQPTSSPAVNKEDASGKASNTLTIHVAKDTVHFMVNGKLVQALAKSQLGGEPTDGQVGIRINHNIDVHVDGFGIKK